MVLVDLTTGLDGNLQLLLHHHKVHWRLGDGVCLEARSLLMRNKVTLSHGRITRVKWVEWSLFLRICLRMDWPGYALQPRTVAHFLDPCAAAKSYGTWRWTCPLGICPRAAYADDWLIDSYRRLQEDMLCTAGTCAARDRAVYELSRTPGRDHCALSSSGHLSV